MKRIFYLVICLILFSCKTKTITTERTSEKDFSTSSLYLDSLFKQSLNIHLNSRKDQYLINENLKLSSSIELDSLGNRKPFHFKHYVDGKLKEEIYLKGGEITKNIDSSTLKQSENKEVAKIEKTLMETDVGKEQTTKKETLNRNKKTTTTGFQFGFYVWSFLILIVLIILRWSSKKINLPNSIKKMLGNKGE